MKLRIGWALVGLVVMALVLTAAYTVIRVTALVEVIRVDQEAGQERSQETAETTNQIERLARVIESCTNPRGKCYRDGQRRTGDAIGSINEITIYAAACAKQPENVTAQQIRACVEESLDVPDPQENR